MRRPRTYLIIGCGHFGSRAVKRLHEKPRSRIIVVDKSANALKEVSIFAFEAVLSEGTEYLARFLSRERRADFIIPAVPYHLAFEFLLSELSPLGARRIQLPDLSGLPNPNLGRSGDLYSSLSDFRCPEDCPEPPKFCTVTQKTRQKPLHQILSELVGPFQSKVIRSYSLSPGVGGFRPIALKELVEEVKEERDRVHTFLISTASRCHGVTSALSFH